MTNNGSMNVSTTHYAYIKLANLNINFVRRLSTQYAIRHLTFKVL